MGASRVPAASRIEGAGNGDGTAKVGEPACRTDIMTCPLPCRHRPIGGRPGLRGAGGPDCPHALRPLSRARVCDASRSAAVSRPPSALRKARDAWMYVWAMFKGLLWPAFMVFEALSAFAG